MNNYYHPYFMKPGGGRRFYHPPPHPMQIQSTHERQMQDLTRRVDQMIIHVPKQIKTELKTLQREVGQALNEYHGRVQAAESETRNLREEVDELKTLLIQAMSTMEQFQREIKEMGLAIEYAAGGPVYQEAKQHFEAAQAVETKKK